MKRKLTSRLLLLALAMVSIGMLGSCKDSNEDSYDELQGKLSQESTLREAVEAQVKTLQTQVTTLQTAQTTLTSSLSDYLKTADFDGKFKTDFDQAFATAIANYKVSITNLESSVTNINNSIAAANKALANDKISIDSLAKVTSDLNKATVAAAATASEALNLAKTASTTANQALGLATSGSATANKALDLARNDSLQIVALKAAVEKLQGNTPVWNDSLKTAYTNAANALAKANTNANWINIYGAEYISKTDSLAKVTKDLKDSINAVKTLAQTNYTKATNYTDEAVRDVVAKLNAAIATEDSKIAQVDGKVDAANLKIKDLQDKYDKLDQALKDAISSLTLQIQKVSDKVDSVALALNNRFTNALSKLVTGILVQATENPVFGSISLPLDIRSNVLMTYYGSSSVDDREFPSYKSTNEAAYDANSCLTYNDYTFLKNNCSLTPENISNGQTLFDASTGNAGTLYLTVNPASTNFSNLNVTLVNSQDKESGIKLSPLTQSDAKLTFGYTRASNGFYEAKATLAESDINAVKVNIEEGFKNSMSDLIKNRAKNVDLTSLATNVYSQFNGLLDANAIKATWSDSLGSHAVYSQYNIAATTMKPLSFKFLQGTSLAKFPTISPLNDIQLNIDSVNFKFNPTFTISGKPASITLSAVQFSADTIKVNVTIPNVASAVFDKNTGKITSWQDTTIVVKISDLKDFVDSLNVKFKGQIDDWNVSINKSLQDQVDDLVKQINSEVTNKLITINGQLNQSVNEVLTEISNQFRDKFDSYKNKLNNYIARINRYTNRINSYLSHPNYYMQVTLLYEGNDGGYHQLSNVKSSPSVFTVSGGNATALLPTTFNAEIVAPAYRKYVAVTNVYKNGTSAQAGDAECLDALKAANSQPNMNTVIAGRRLTVPFYAKATDCVYEITYSALDYTGYSSTRKYYVKVVK